MNYTMTKLFENEDDRTCNVCSRFVSKACQQPWRFWNFWNNNLCIICKLKLYGFAFGHRLLLCCCWNSTIAVSSVGIYLAWGFPASLWDLFQDEAISSNVLFLVSGRYTYIKIQKNRRNAVKGRKEKLFSSF